MMFTCQKSVGSLKAKETRDEKKRPKKHSTPSKIPNVECVDLHAYTAFSVDQHGPFDMTNAPGYMKDFKTNCVYMTTLINTKDLPLNLRMYLPFVVHLLMKNTVAFEGIKIHNLDIVDELEMDLILWNSKSLPLTSAHFMPRTISSVVPITINFEPKMFDLGVKWMYDFLFNTKITEKQFSEYLRKTFNYYYRCTSDVSRLLKEIMRHTIYKKNSNIYSCGILRHAQFTGKLINKINNKEWVSVNEDLINVKLFLTNPNNLKMHVSADSDVLNEMKPEASFMLEKLFPSNVKCLKKSSNNILFDSDYVIPNDECTLRACAVGVDDIENSYFVQVADCVCDYGHPDMAALLVFLKYFIQPNGPVDKKLSTLGHTFSCNIALKPNEKLITLNFLRSVNLPNAYEETKLLLENYLNGSEVWDQTLLESAKRCMYIDFMDSEMSISNIVKQSILYYSRNLSPDYNRTIIKEISKTTLKELQQIGKKYVMPLFDPKCARTTMICPSSKLKTIADEFKKLGLDVKTFNSVDTCFLLDVFSV